MAYQVLIPQMVADEGIDYLESHGYIVKMGRGATEADLIADVADCDAILLRTAPCTRAVLEAGKNLKIVARHGAGYDNIDLEAADELGIWATNAPLATSESVAEFTLGAIISAAKRIPVCSNGMRRGEFFYKNSHKGIDLENKYLGIVGFGRIGQAVANIARDLGRNVLSYSRTRRPEGEALARYVDLDTLLAQSDFVSLHCPLTPATAKLINADTLAKMKDGAILINTSRGGLLDEAAVKAALESGRLRAAAVDVVSEEPITADNPLLTAPNCIITPHMAWAPLESRQRLLDCVIENIRCFLDGKPQNVVNL